MWSSTTRSLIKAAAAKGFKKHNLACCYMYEEGEGVAMNKTEATKWRAKNAAAEGYTTWTEECD